MFFVTYCKKCLPDAQTIMAITDKVDIQYSCSDHPRQFTDVKQDNGRMKRVFDTIEDYTGAFMVTDDLGFVPGGEIKPEQMDEVRRRYAKMFAP